MKKNSFLKKPLFFIPVLFIIGGIIISYFIFSGGSANNFETATAQISNLKEEVSVTGQVKPSEEVSLAFEKSGKVSSVFVSVGDKVYIGETLASLNNADISANLAKAKANLKSEEANFLELKRGARAEDIAIKEAELGEAKQDLINYYDDVPDVVADSYTYADDAIRVKTAGIFSGSLSSGSFSLTYSSCDQQVKSDAESLKLLSEKNLNSWNSEISDLKIKTMPGSEENYEKALSQAENYLSTTKAFLEKTSGTFISGCGLSDTSLSTYRLNTSTARINIISSVKNINALKQSIVSQKLTISKIENELKLKLAGSSKEELASEEAKVEEAEANVKSYEAELQKTIIFSPINATVTKQDAKVGEIISSGVSVISLISESKLEIETKIAEVDIAKIKVGNPAKVTLDAYGNDVIFEAVISKTDPAETVVEGVSTYKTTLQFKDKDDRIRSGMTANIDIETASRENVIAIPERAVISKDGIKIVRIPDKENKDTGFKEVEVKTGVKGSDGKIEITTGLKEGDEVVVYSSK
ncbi:MAG: hypothetical protein A2430_02775 [Candidatus Liptonbacteria bacterium RIFOXYC1_FULL_36_8]|uniref:Uncharacterized protein n=3 Tax=Candidatus Liptoniibacteriota TaxID=1817909 RepID=A0A1G2CR63_9BACT|nr:MAG: hypothetical protein A2390_01665 [Candidatus Liptonbacteria bacterium RIFOXYB1_FULL_36_10]OGZ04148.1 MAG: hypothetical protein A2430_02775 [Candidatus Liptonbacteria bacterium RIFOXYC1_FULL_36_8]OGZ04523.1 MAG: hypothetical protein A2604_01245 [Candidatus Liptonbacteria bacterium RIFOXYD1_FULL_36_11]